MQNAVLCFKDWQGKEFISGITQGQREGTHINLNGANDWNGRGGDPELCDLLAPFDCVVKAIARGDNTVFFESLGEVNTPTGKYSRLWFMCAHMNDSDFRLLGIAVGKVFRQGQPCYTEGTKGIGAGAHIHMEQGFGRFGGGSSPYYRSNDSFVFGGHRYAQYYPVLAKESYECPMPDIFFWKKGVGESRSAREQKEGKMYAGKVRYTSDMNYTEQKVEPPKPEPKPTEDITTLETLKNELKTTNEKIQSLTTERDNYRSQAEKLKNDTLLLMKESEALASEKVVLRQKIAELEEELQGLRDFKKKVQDLVA